MLDKIRNNPPPTLLVQHANDRPHGKSKDQILAVAPVAVIEPASRAAFCAKRALGAEAVQRVDPRVGQPKDVPPATAIATVRPTERTEFLAAEGDTPRAARPTLHIKRHLIEHGLVSPRTPLIAGPS